jgi:hypothetical protein
MVPTLRAARAFSLAAFLAAGCSVSTEAPGPAFKYDGGPVEGGSSSSSGGSSSNGGSTSSGSGGFDNDANACQPGSVATYNPGKYKPASGEGQGACLPSAAMPDPIGAFYDSCFGPSANATDCNDLRQKQATCVACILTPDSAAKYGPLIDHGSFVTANVAGCLELFAPGSLSCATAVQELGGCELAACMANCPVHDASSLADYEACATQVEAAGCQMYTAAADCAFDVPDAAPAAAACLGDFQSFYQAVVPRFCGPAVDAGGTAPIDAGSGGD